MTLPLVGELSILSFIVLLFCLAFAIVWIVKRKSSYAWIGQDILVSFMYKYPLFYVLA